MDAHGAGRREAKRQEERGKPVREGVHGHKDSESEVCKERGRHIAADIFETALCLVGLQISFTWRFILWRTSAYP